jgi:hypothetical protein
MGQASGVTWALEDLTAGAGTANRTLASGSATVASWTLTTNAAAGPNTLDARKASVTATTGSSIGAPAVIKGADGARVLVTSASITSGASVKFEAPLSGTYASGSTVAGVLLTASIPDSIGSNSTLFDNDTTVRIVWTYTLDGMIHRVPIPVKLGRHTQGDLAVGEALTRLKRLYPDLSGRLPDGGDLDKMAMELAEEVADDLRMRGIDPARFLIGPGGSRILIARILAHMADHGYRPGSNDLADGDFVTHARQDYRRRLEAATIGLPGDGAQQTTIVNDLAIGPEYRPFTLIM